MSIHRSRLAGRICRELLRLIQSLRRLGSGCGPKPAGESPPLIGPLKLAGLFVHLGHHVKTLDGELSCLFTHVNGLSCGSGLSF